MQQVVSSDPGGAYMGGLTAELSAAWSVEHAWQKSLERLETGLETWVDTFTETGDYNATRYRADVARVQLKLAEAKQAVLVAHRAIVEQQKANLADYERRVEEGLAR